MTGLWSRVPRVSEATQDHETGEAPTPVVKRPGRADRTAPAWPRHRKPGTAAGPQPHNGTP